MASARPRNISTYIYVVQHTSGEFLGLMEDHCEGRGIPFTYVRPFAAGGKLPATVESGKWVGPAKSAAGGEVVEAKEELIRQPSLANDDPYGAGWMVVLDPEDWDNVKGML